MYWRLLGSSMFDARYSGVFKKGMLHPYGRIYGACTFPKIVHFSVGMGDVVFISIIFYKKRKRHNLGTQDVYKRNAHLEGKKRTRKSWKLDP